MTFILKMIQNLPSDQKFEFHQPPWRSLPGLPPALLSGHRQAAKRDGWGPGAVQVSQKDGAFRHRNLYNNK